MQQRWVEEKLRVACQFLHVGLSNYRYQVEVDDTIAVLGIWDRSIGNSEETLQYF